MEVFDINQKNYRSQESPLGYPDNTGALSEVAPSRKKVCVHSSASRRMLPVKFVI